MISVYKTLSTVIMHSKKKQKNLCPSNVHHVDNLEHYAAQYTCILSKRATGLVNCSYWSSELTLLCDKILVNIADLSCTEVDTG